VGELHIVGVRHHSPACARVVAHAIATRRPTHVLIEGPSDFEGRMGELVLGHALPIAIYSYALADSPAARAVGVWSPLCDYSPEWVAIEHGMRSGADVRFIDLPAWDEAFRDVENRYADRELDQHHRQITLGRELGFDASDTLWDHLFEDPERPIEVLSKELETYFDALRGDDPTSARDMRRESFMARYIAWAMAVSDGVVLVVCGGFHAPALRRLWATFGPPEPTAPTTSTLLPSPPTPPTPAPPQHGVRTGSYVVPFSMRRLDSFAGYASGMPSPAFYQAVWQDGAQAWETMLMRAVERLRTRGQPVSTADLLTASELAHGLARLRGNGTPRRSDVLDALTAAFVKDALAQPTPWTVRGVLPRGTDPVLVEVVAAFSGDVSGRLATGTPRPPLVDDVEAQLTFHGLDWTSAMPARRVRLDPLDPADTARRHVLYRLLILGVPGVGLIQRASLLRGTAAPSEHWQLERLLESDATLIERAVYGADLATAALARLQERVASASAVVDLIAALEDALSAGYLTVAETLGRSALVAIQHEPSLAEMGKALARLVTLETTASLTSGEHTSGLRFQTLLVTALERAGWLLEGRDGASAALVRQEVDAVAAMVSALVAKGRVAPRSDGLESDPLRVATVALFGRRAAASSAPPWLRGACLGALWTLGEGDEAAATASLMATPDIALGDTLVGLLALAREPFGRSSLLDLVDQRLATLDDATFLAILPSLRAAFAQLPPPERLALAKRVADKKADAHALVAPLREVDLSAGVCLENQAFAILKRFGILS
jgi:hypothetical protein